MRGGFNKTHGITMGGHTVKHAIERAGVEAGEVEDVIFGSDNQREQQVITLEEMLQLQEDAP